MVFWLERELRFWTNWIIFVIWSRSHLEDYRIVFSDSSSSRKFFFTIIWWTTYRGSYTANMFKRELVCDPVFDRLRRVMQISEIWGIGFSSETLKCHITRSEFWYAFFSLFLTCRLVPFHYTPSLAPDSPCDDPTHLTGSCCRLLARRSWCRILYGLWVAIKWESVTLGKSFIAWVTEKNCFY